MQTTLRLLIVAIWLVGLSHCACTKDHPKVGLTSELSTLDHDVEGTVVVVDDCSFRVDGFKYDGTGPDVFWYAADERKNLASGFIMDSIPRSKGVWDGTEVVSIKLPGGTTWDDVNIISVWCRQFGVNFGDAVLPEPKESVPEEPPSKKVNDLLEASDEKGKKAPVDEELSEATEKAGSLSGGSLGSFSGASSASFVSFDPPNSGIVSDSFGGEPSNVSIRGTSTTRASGDGSTKLKQRESSPDTFAIDQEENENGSLMAQSSLLVVLGTLVVSILVGPT